VERNCFSSSLPHEVEKVFPNIKCRGRKIEYFFRLGKIVGIDPII
jgi:hypothetical protein